MNKHFIAFVFLVILGLSVYVGSLENRLYLYIAIPVLMLYLLSAILRRSLFTWQAVKSLDNTFKIHGNSLKDHPLISIIVPCYNEDKTIVKSLSSLVKLDYPKYEVIVVNDGSTDKTLEKANELASKITNVVVKVLSKKNGGKASALNFGISQAKGNYILCVDGDSRLNPEALVCGMKHFENDPKIGAVAGFVSVDNQTNLITKLQEYEYLVGLNLVRRCLGNYGITPVIPGPIGLFRKEVLTEVGGFLEDARLMAEDAELSLRIISRGWKISSEENMISYTEAPEDWLSLIRQRYRWNRGILQALELNLMNLIKGKKFEKILAFFLMYETYQIPLANWSMLAMFLSHYFFTGEILLLDKWFIGIMISEAITVILVTYRNPKFLKWLWIAFIGQFIYNIILMTWRGFCFVDEYFSLKMSWDKLERKG